MPCGYTGRRPPSDDILVALCGLTRGQMEKKLKREFGFTSFHARCFVYDNKKAIRQLEISSGIESRYLHHAPPLRDAWAAGQRDAGSVER